MVCTVGRAALTDPEALHRPGTRRPRGATARLGAIRPSAPRRSLAADVVERVIAQRAELSDEQRAMVRAVCCSGEFVQPIAGRPGAGKTYAIEAVVAAHVDAGVPIVGCAVSATAAAELERAAGFARSTGAPASTVARLLWDLDDPNAPVWLRARSSWSTRPRCSAPATSPASPATSATPGGAVKLVGDPDQHGAVDVGGVFRRLCAERGEGLVRLVDNNRQQDHIERLAIAEYREGHVADALARYDEAGKVVRSRTAGESFDAIVADWYAARLHGRADPMIAGPNSTRRALNDRARALLKANGELTGKPSSSRGREFMVGDEVVARRNDRRLHAVGATRLRQERQRRHRHRHRPPPRGGRRRVRTRRHDPHPQRLPRRRASRARLRPHHLRRPGRHP